LAATFGGLHLRPIDRDRSLHVPLGGIDRGMDAGQENSPGHL